MTENKVLSLGQCGADHASIGGLLRTHFGAEVVVAHTCEDALTKLRQGGFALVLVNRVLDYDGRPGLDFIDGLKADPQLCGVPVMLVSNYADAQREAVARGRCWASASRRCGSRRRSGGCGRCCNSRLRLRTACEAASGSPLPTRRRRHRRSARSCFVTVDAELRSSRSSCSSACFCSWYFRLIV